MNLLWDVIAAKGFEKDMYFEQAAVDIRALPKLEGTVHVNIALIVKFMANYFFAPADYPEVPRQDQAANDDFLFNQGPTKGLGKIRFHDYNIAYSSRDTANLEVFREQIAAFKKMLFSSPPDEAQRKDIDFLLAAGDIFALVVYGQLILENASIYDVSDDLVDQIFDFMVRDFSRHALNLYSKPSSNEKQMECCLEMIRKPVFDDARYQRVWQQVYDLRDEYEMNP
jgi:acyl-CoA dehydrogenase